MTGAHIRADIYGAHAYAWCSCVFANEICFHLYDQCQCYFCVFFCFVVIINKANNCALLRAWGNERSAFASTHNEWIDPN